MLSLGEQGVNEFTQRAKDGDVGVVVWRSKNHSLVPAHLNELLEWRKGFAGSGEKVPRARLGVFHIANEKDREDWPWYVLPDFVVRNYWIRDIGGHVEYVPLGPQMPSQCRPGSTEGFGMNGEDICDCGGLRYKRASERKYVWNFTGSLRKRRAELLRILRKRDGALNGRGYVHVSKKFGGDGVFGSLRNNPKTEYLESILESQFVFAPCGNAMETHRIYEAVGLGAIPVIENCDEEVSRFFPMRELVIDGGPEGMVKFVERFVDKMEYVDALQERVGLWWDSYKELVARNVSRVVSRHVPPVWRKAP